jgi:hypothetical protein
MDKPRAWAQGGGSIPRDQNQASNEVQSGVHPSNRIRQIIKKRQRVRQMDKPQAWAQCGGSIPRDHNHESNEVQSINQVETNVDRQRRLVREDICRVLEQQLERQSSNLSQYQQGDGYFPTASQQKNTGMSQIQQDRRAKDRERKRKSNTGMTEKEKEGLNEERHLKRLNLSVDEIQEMSEKRRLKSVQLSVEEIQEMNEKRRLKSAHLSVEEIQEMNEKRCQRRSESCQ